MPTGIAGGLPPALGPAAALSLPQPTSSSAKAKKPMIAVGNIFCIQTCKGYGMLQMTTWVQEFYRIISNRGSGPQSLQPIAGILQVGFRFREAEAQEIFTGGVMVESISWYSGDAG